MGWQEYVGYVGSFLMFSTFWMKTMIPLRLVGIAANCAIGTYAATKDLYPMVAMHVLMLPVNVYRLEQMRALLLRVSNVTEGRFQPDALLPFMSRERHSDGSVLFARGDESDKLYLIREGEVRLKELGYVLSPGELLGEIGILSDSNRRTATAICDGEVVLYSITRDDVTQLFFQNPEFGYFLMRLVTDRLLQNQSAAEQA